MSFVPLYDLESLNEQQRQDYVRAVCNHMGVPPELNLVMLTYLDEGGDGPRRLVAYAKRGATEIVRNNRGINITDLRQDKIGGSIVWTATGKDSTGRQEMSSGAKYIEALTGKELDDAIMTAQTRACRRMTLQFVGAGVLDESEVNPSRPVATKETAFASMAVAPQPTAQPSNEPGKDVTMIGPSQDSKTQAQVAAVIAIREIQKITSETPSDVPYATTPEDFTKQQEELRADAIAQLNAKFPSTETPAKKPRKPRGPNKPKVDMGPSELPVKVTPEPASTQPAVIVSPQSGSVPGTAYQSLPQIVMVPLAAPVTTGKPRLSPEQVKPYRQRQFKFVNELEENGFLPKEGMGNQDKMRAFAGIMFSEVTNFNELTSDQWEKYLTTVESKLSAVGAKETIKYIEDAIGI